MSFSTVSNKRGLLVFAIFLLFLVTPLIVTAATTGGSSISPDTINNSGTATVTYTLTGDSAYSPTPRDVIFLVDGSGSMQQEGFDLAKNVITQTINALAAEDHFVNGGRVGLVLFADANDTETILSLADGDVQADALNAVQNLVYPEGSSCLAEGIDLAVADFDTNSSPARNRLIVLVTDGGIDCDIIYPDGDQAHLIATGIAARNLGITFVGAGVGNVDALYKIESLFDDPDTEFVLIAIDPDLTPSLYWLVGAIRMVDITNNLYFEVGSRFDPPTNLSADLGTVAQFGQEVTWTLYGLGNTTATLTYDIAVDCSQGPAGDLPVHNYIDYSDSEAGVINFDLLSVTLNCFSDLDDDGVPDDEDDYPNDPTRSVECPAGKFGFHSCISAPAGTYVDAAGATAPEPCLPGTYQDQSGQISCKPAEPGSFVAVDGAAETTDCPVGRYQDEYGADSCKEAPIGTYASVQGLDTPESCPAGTSTENTASASVDACLTDTDGDGEPDTIDTDDDDDGILDVDDAYPTVAAETQEIALQSGWNLISGYIAHDTCTPAFVFRDLGAQLVLVKDGAGDIYWPDLGIDGIACLDARQSYQVYVQGPQTLMFYGQVIDPTATSFDLVSGWNMAGYWLETPTAVNTAIDSISGQLLLVKDGDGLIYWPGYNVNQIGDLQPGKGYLAYLNNPGTLSYAAGN